LFEKAQTVDLKVAMVSAHDYKIVEIAKQTTVEQVSAVIRAIRK
jgi:hypothetical protein